MLNLFNKKSAEATEKSPEEKKLKSPVKDGISPANVRGAFGAKGRRLSGTVVSDKMKKTVIVAVSYEKKHSKYLKYFTKTTRFKAHDENNEYHVGDKVMIQETKPMSKEKRWIVISKQ